MNTEQNTVEHTLTQDEPPAATHPAERWALVVVWSPKAPERLGEVLLPSATPRIFGRGSQPGRAPRLGLVQQRPGRNAPSLPLQLRRLSREQLLLRATAEGVHVENVGRCDATVNNAPLEGPALLEVGDRLLLRGQMMFLCERRPPALPPLPELKPHPFGEPDPFGMIGESPAAWAIREQLAFFGPRTAHVLIHGASGVGKELAASALHALSPRRTGPLVSRNAATLPEGIFDAELFGNLANYPNPGTPDRPGLIGAADGGTLFLDEFAELPEAIQAHLLRVLDGGEYQRLGESRLRASDFRLIAATNRDLSAIKHDVLARLPLRLHLPGLGERRADIPLLARHLLRQIARQDDGIARRFFPGADPAAEPRVSAALIDRLLSWRWTSHARELLGLLWQSMAASLDGTLLPPPSPPPSLPTIPDAAPDVAAYVGADPDTIPPAVVQACLDACNGVQEQAWQALGLQSRFVLRRLIKKHQLIIRRTS